MTTHLSPRGYTLSIYIYSLKLYTCVVEWTSNTKVQTEDIYKNILIRVVLHVLLQRDWIIHIIYMV